MYLVIIQQRGADIRHTTLGSPQTTNRYGNAAPVIGAVPILFDCSVSQVVIESLLSSICPLKPHLAESICKITKRFWIVK